MYAVNIKAEKQYFSITWSYKTQTILRYKTSLIASVFLKIVPKEICQNLSNDEITRRRPI